jgi:hypothetical protein
MADFITESPADIKSESVADFRRNPQVAAEATGVRLHLDAAGAVQMTAPAAPPADLLAAPRADWAGVVVLHERAMAAPGCLDLSLMVLQLIEICMLCR